MDRACGQRQRLQSVLGQAGVMTKPGRQNRPRHVASTGCIGRYVAVSSLAVALVAVTWVVVRPVHASSPPLPPALQQTESGEPGSLSASMPDSDDEDADSRWGDVLERLDRRRERAWRVGDVHLLQGVFTSGSPAFNRDATMLRSYLRRGLRVDRVSLRLHTVVVVDVGHRCAQLNVIDQLGAAVARDGMGHRVALPADQPTRQLLRLRRTAQGWRISGVRNA